jgi:hypothetical protein
VNLVLKNSLLCFVFCFPSIFAQAKGVSPYLPLNTDPLFELQIERLASITQMPVLNKPFHIVTVVEYLNKIKTSHPTLYNRLVNYIKRYQKQGGITHLSSKVGYSDNNKRTQDNNRGIKLDSSFQTTAIAFYQFNKYIIANVGGTIVDANQIIPSNSYISFGYEYLQIDLGYREHWSSPLQESASLLSTNAKPALSLTMSNVKPITSWNAKYEFSLGQLDEMEGIRFNGAVSSGKPLIMGMHFSIQPFDWWTIGANRTFQFGGGERNTGFSDVWKAIIDPVNSDNCGSGETGCANSNVEVGNQIASITNRFDLSFQDFPFTLYFEYAGEDTKDHKNYELGNLAYNLGLFLPYFSESSSLYLEYADYHTHWYEHHIYAEGYRNDGAIMGHWWANNRKNGDLAGAIITTARFNIDLTNKSHLAVTLKSVDITDKLALEDYQRTNELEISLRHTYLEGFIGMSLKAGQDSYGDSYYRTEISYTW